MKAWFLERWCRFRQHQLDWVYDEGVKALYCYKCRVIHEFAEIPSLSKWSERRVDI